MVTRIFALKSCACLPNQPRIGRLDGSSLVILDGKGRELWKKFFPEGFGPDYYYNEKLSWAGGTHLWFADLEGKGHTSVLFRIPREPRVSRRTRQP